MNVFINRSNQLARELARKRERPASLDSGKQARNEALADRADALDYQRPHGTKRASNFLPAVADFRRTRKPTLIFERGAKAGRYAVVIGKAPVAPDPNAGEREFSRAVKDASLLAKNVKGAEGVVIFDSIDPLKKAHTVKQPTVGFVTTFDSYVEAQAFSFRAPHGSREVIDRWENAHSKEREDKIEVTLD